MSTQGTLSTGRAMARDRHPSRTDDTRRIRNVDADGWNREALADMADDLVFSRYLARGGRVRG